MSGVAWFCEVQGRKCCSYWVDGCYGNGEGKFVVFQVAGWMNLFLEFKRFVKCLKQAEVVGYMVIGNVWIS